MGIQGNASAGNDEQSLRDIISQELQNLNANGSRGSSVESNGQDSPSRGRGGSSSLTSNNQATTSSLRQIIREELARMQTPSRKASRSHVSGQSLSPSGSSSGTSSKSSTQAPDGSQTGDSPSTRSNTAGTSGTASSQQGKAASASYVGESTKSKKATVQPKTSANTEQTVAQVLTQAQYELSQELEENLQKLRSVIQQSQEIAKKIELVLGHGEKGSGNKE